MILILLLMSKFILLNFHTIYQLQKKTQESTFYAKLFNVQSMLAVQKYGNFHQIFTTNTAETKCAIQ